MSKAEKLQRIREAKDPTLALTRQIGRFAEEIKVAKGDKGDDGQTPVFGVDYFTAEQVREIVDYVIAEVSAGVSDGAPGEKGETGDQGKTGKAGKTPELGVDYFTKKDRESIIAEVQKGVTNGKNGETPRISTIVEAVITAMEKQTIPYSRLKGGPDPKDLAELVAFLKRGGYRGGGSSTGSTGSSGSVINATNTGDGKHYTLAAIPSTNAFYVIINNGVYTTDDASFGFTAVGFALTFTNTLPADLQNTLIKLVCV